jgi:dipeptidase E
MPAPVAERLSGRRDENYGMRLYLSSYRLGDHPELFAQLVTGHRRGWVIMNALDGMDEGRRRADLEVQIADLRSIGLAAEDFDLRQQNSESIRARFGNPDFVWVRGGNVFTLRAAMAKSGLDALVVEHVRSDKVVYAGFSAGSCVLAPSLAGLELCDPVDFALATYGAVCTDGLGILDRPIVPHLRSPGHPETELLGAVAMNYDAQGQPYWALDDGQALIIDGAEPRVV